jgi:hypothetical protein
MVLPGVDFLGIGRECLRRQSENVRWQKSLSSRGEPALLSGGLVSIGPAGGEAATQEFSIGAGSGKA